MSFRKSIVIVCILLAIASEEVYSQWKQVVKGLVPNNATGHAMCFNNGILWIAADSLYKSLDSGITWNGVIRIPGVPYDVDFIDGLHGIIASGNNTYLTTDGGVSIQQLNIASYSACFGRDALTMGIAEPVGNVGNLRATSDGGNTWSTFRSGVPYCVRRSPSGNLLFFSGSSPGAIITWTSDKGATWNSGTGGIDWDSYSFAPDSCDPNRIYLSHEDVGAVKVKSAPDLFSKILLTTDLGNTWQAVVSNPQPFFCGSVAAGRQAIYCPTFANGIFRSLDRGLTWKSIGGPNNTYDTRLIAAIDDNIIIAADIQGNIWRTLNSGGDSVKLMPGLGTLTLSTDSLFTKDTLSCGNSLAEPITMQRSGCIPALVVRASVIGADSASYSAALINADSISVLFDPPEAGQYQAHLVLTLGDGTSDTIALAGTIVGGNSALSMATADQRTDTIGATVNVPVQFNGLLGAENIDVVMHYTGADLVYDSSVDLLGMKIDIPSEQWQGRSMLHLVNAQSGIIAGYARFNVFSDSSEKPVVTFDSVHVQAAGCKYQLPVPVWSTITPVQGCGVPLISELMKTGHIPNLSFSPNPTTGDLIISSSSDLGNATVEIYDMLGIERSQTELTLSVNSPIQLVLPQVDGIYTVRVRSAAGVYSSRMIVRR
jgi:photosystem II stability/assembly factor-like uncharacterized protein